MTRLVSTELLMPKHISCRCTHTWAPLSHNPVLLHS